MGERGCVAIWEDKTNGVIRGRYVHWDGHPAGLGKELISWVADNGLGKTVEILIDSKDAKAGWSALYHKANPESPEWQPYLNYQSYWRLFNDDEYLIQKVGEIQYTYVLCDKHIEVYSGDELIGEVDYSDVDKMKKLQ